jgi:hypothetical protein
LRQLALSALLCHEPIMVGQLPPRTPWSPGFPDVVIHTTVKTRDAHPSYAAAKAGDAEAALVLAGDLICLEAIVELQDMIGESPAILLPVVADETGGFSAIPDAMAQLLAHKLGLIAQAGGIVQINKVGHTRAPAFQRLVTPAEFDGEVEEGGIYILVDDHVGLGGTLANLKGYLETNGATVIGITTLTESRDARRIALQPATHDMLWEKHGEALDQIWQAQFGHGIDCLTDVEAQILCRQQTVDAIEDFLAQAAVEARGRGLRPILGAA